MSLLSVRILSSSSSLRIMMSSSSSSVGGLGVFIACLLVWYVSPCLSGLSESESDSVPDDDDDDSDSELSSSVFSDSDSSSSLSDSSVVILSGFCGAFHNLFFVVSGKIRSMFKRCRFSANSFSVNF